MSSIEKSIETDNSLISGSQKQERELGVIAGGTGLFFSFFLSFRHFLGRSQGIWRFPGWGLIGAVAAGLCQSYHPQQCGIWAVSANFISVFKNCRVPEVPVMVHRKRIQLGTMRFRVWSLASLSGLSGILRCCELWCRPQMWLPSGVAVTAV